MAGTIEYATLENSAGCGAGGKQSEPVTSPSFHGATEQNYQLPVQVAARQAGCTINVRKMEVSAGQCVVHAQDTWHGSGPNTSACRHRRALVVHFVRGDARFVKGHALEVTGHTAYDTMFAPRLVHYAMSGKDSCTMLGTTAVLVCARQRNSVIKVACGSTLPLLVCTRSNDTGCKIPALHRWAHAQHPATLACGLNTYM